MIDYNTHLFTDYIKPIVVLVILVEEVTNTSVEGMIQHSTAKCRERRESDTFEITVMETEKK